MSLPFIWYQKVRQLPLVADIAVLVYMALSPFFLGALVSKNMYFPVVRINYNQLWSCARDPYWQCPISRLIFCLFSCRCPIKGSTKYKYSRIYICILFLKHSQNTSPEIVIYPTLKTTEGVVKGRPSISCRSLSVCDYPVIDVIHLSVSPSDTVWLKCAVHCNQDQFVTNMPTKPWILRIQNLHEATAVQKSKKQ